MIYKKVNKNNIMSYVQDFDDRPPHLESQSFFMVLRWNG